MVSGRATEHCEGHSCVFMHLGLLHPLPTSRCLAGFLCSLASFAKAGLDSSCELRQVPSVPVSSVPAFFAFSRRHTLGLPELVQRKGFPFPSICKLSKTKDRYLRCHRHITFSPAHYLDLRSPSRVWLLVLGGHPSSPAAILLCPVS